MMSGITVPSGPVPVPYTITSYDGCYWVSLNVSMLTDFTTDFRALLVWLYSLKSTDTVRLMIHCGSASAYPSFDTYLPILNALNLCAAKIIGMVDHIFSGTDAYFLLTCDVLQLTPYGQINLDYPRTALDDKVSEAERAATEFGIILLKNAVKVGLLTDDEFSRLQSLRTVYLSPDLLAQRT